MKFAALRICPMPSRRWPVRRGRPLLKVSLGTRPAMTTTVQITLHGKPQKHRDVEAVSVPKWGLSPEVRSRPSVAPQFHEFVNHMFRGFINSVMADARKSHAFGNLNEKRGL